MSWYRGFRPYVPVARRRADAAREMAKLAKKGHTISPVTIEGRQIATTFWGKAWCDNLESYSDFENRLPRGRTYVRNGSVVDLQINSGEITARVSGSHLYQIHVRIKPLPSPQWSAISGKCAGRIGSVLELLQGRLSKSVMEIITHRESGLFPKPSEISLKCSCPDWADMCKHVAAALYGVGARLDEKPELLFVLRQVDHLELIEQAATAKALAPAARSDRPTIAQAELSDVFGIELDATTPAAPIQSRGRSRRQTGPAKPSANRSRARRQASAPPAPASRKRSKEAPPSATAGKKRSPGRPAPSNK